VFQGENALDVAVGGVGLRGGVGVAADVCESEVSSSLAVAGRDCQMSAIFSL
jgi:hypothetical protein